MTAVTAHAHIFAAPAWLADRVIVPPLAFIANHLPLMFAASLLLLTAGAVVALRARHLRKG